MSGSLTMDIVIKATPERVFRAWTTAEDFVAWWGDDETYRTTTFECDLRPGGKWRSGGVTKDGRPFSVGGEYLVVDPPLRLSFTWDPDWETIGPTTVEIEFQAIPEGTRLVVTHSGFPTSDSQESHNQGWTRVLAWLTQYIESEL